MSTVTIKDVERKSARAYFYQLEPPKLFTGIALVVIGIALASGAR